MKNDPRRNYDIEFFLYPISLTRGIFPSMPKEIESKSVVITQSNQGIAEYLIGICMIIYLIRTHTNNISYHDQNCSLSLNLLVCIFGSFTWHVHTVLSV